MYTGIVAVKRPPLQANDIGKRFDQVEAAPALQDVLPRGAYEADWVGISVGENRNGKPRIVLSFDVIDDDFLGTKLWLDLYLTPPAMACTKRELVKLDIEKSEDWKRPVPHWLRCSVKVIVETGDDGKQRNKITDFKVISYDCETPDPFAPKDEGGAA